MLLNKEKYNRDLRRKSENHLKSQQPEDSKVKTIGILQNYFAYTCESLFSSALLVDSF